MRAALAAAAARLGLGVRAAPVAAADRDVGARARARAALARLGHLDRLQAARAELVAQAELVGEAADLLFHLLVLLAEAGVPLDDVLAELDRREGVSGIAEKAARPND